MSQKFEIGISLSDTIQRCINDLADRINDSLPQRDWKDMNMIYHYHSENGACIENPFWDARIFIPIQNRWVSLGEVEADFGDQAIKLAKEKCKESTS